MKIRILSLFIFIIVLIFFSFVSYKNYDKDPYGDIIIGNTSLPSNKYHLHRDFTVEKVASGQVPTSIDFASDGRLFFSELRGQIKVIANGMTNIFASVPDSQTPLVEKGESGLFSVAIDPDFDNNKYVYVYYISKGTGKIGRYKDSGGMGKNFEIIFDGIAQGKIHNGGDLNFGPDGKLYLSTGDATEIKIKLGTKNPAQDTMNKNGKILRMNKDGSIPNDNPIPGSYTYAYGFRNVYGFTIDKSGNIFASDNGIDCCDELNFVKPNKNYGWPLEMGIVEKSEYEQPIYAWNKENRIAPTGMSFYYGNKYSKEYVGNLFINSWRNREIYRFIQNDGKIYLVESFLVDDLYDLAPITGMHAGEIHEGQVTDSGSAKESEGLLDIEQGPDGLLYFSDVRGIYRMMFKKIRD
jgi:glucose/arabinose dehydrogenase